MSGDEASAPTGASVPEAEASGAGSAQGEHAGAAAPGAEGSAAGAASAGAETSASDGEAAGAAAGAEPPAGPSEHGDATRRRGGGGPRVQALDFSQPTKFTTELRHRISHVLEPFCKAVALRLAGELKVPVELQQIDARQLSWSAARAMLPQDPLLVALEVRPIEKQMLLVAEESLILRTLDCLLGGTPVASPAPRKLSDIDWALTRRLLNAAVLQLSLAWRDLGDMEVALQDIETDGDAGVVIPSGEPTFTVKFECLTGDVSSELLLLIPWSAIEPVAAQILDHDGVPLEADPEQALALHRGLATTTMLVRAEIGSTEVPVETVLSIAPGALLALEAKAEHGVRLLADRVALARGMPGRSGAHKAVKLTSPVEPRTDPTVRPLVAPSPRGGAGPSADSEGALRRLGQLREIDLHVWAELGRTQLTLGGALRLPQGAVLELDQNAEDPVELFVNGVGFASGSLVVTDDGQWAVEVSALS